VDCFITRKTIALRDFKLCKIHRKMIEQPKVLTLHL